MKLKKYILILLILIGGAILISLIPHVIEHLFHLFSIKFNTQMFYGLSYLAVPIYLGIVTNKYADKISIHKVFLFLSSIFAIITSVGILYNENLLLILLDDINFIDKIICTVIIGFAYVVYFNVYLIARLKFKKNN